MEEIKWVMHILVYISEGRDRRLSDVWVGEFWSKRMEQRAKDIEE